MGRITAAWCGTGRWVKEKSWKVQLNSMLIVSQLINYYVFTTGGEKQAGNCGVDWLVVQPSPLGFIWLFLEAIIFS